MLEENEAGLCTGTWRDLASRSSAIRYTRTSPSELNLIACPKGPDDMYTRWKRNPVITPCELVGVVQSLGSFKLQKLTIRRKNRYHACNG